jgi:segregation and condensation protein B
VTGRAELARALEALVMVADRPVDTALLARLLDASAQEVEEACVELAAGYEVDGRGFILTRVAGGWRYQSHPDLAPVVERFVLEGQSARLSAAALETLAVVAYKQPISRAQVAAIRGVNVDGVMRTLEQRGYIAETGRDPGPGQAVLFATTEQFLEKLGLDRLEDLPDLSGFVPDAEVVELLEQGLRPSGAAPTGTPAAPTGTSAAPTGTPAAPTGTPAAPTGTSAAPTGPAPDDASGVDPGQGAESPVGVTDTPAGDDSAPPAGDADVEDLGDPLARLEETTARLDALVDEVRGRVKAAEDAVAEREDAEVEDEGAGGDGEPDDGG